MHPDRNQVAPRAGAWIETFKDCKDANEYLVAPRAGAWIETLNQMRYLRLPGVAPRAGAWIETTEINRAYRTSQSHPVRVRGLKHCRSEVGTYQTGRTPCGCVD